MIVKKYFSLFMILLLVFNFSVYSGDQVYAAGGWEYKANMNERR